MEQRVLALGQENNLVKNLSEIVKRRKWVIVYKFDIYYYFIFVKLNTKLKIYNI
jgi:hypothetical protein